MRFAPRLASQMPDAFRAVIAALLLGAAILIERVLQTPVGLDAMVRPLGVVVGLQILFACLLGFGFNWGAARFLTAGTTGFALGEVGVGLLLLCAWVTARWWGHVRAMGQGLTLVSVLLIAMQLLRAAGSGAIALPDMLPRPSNAVANVPDIYFLLLDGYPRSDTLGSFGQDNSRFEAALRSRGFQISSKSHSNYTRTWLSLATMFNLAHLHDLRGPTSSDPPHEQIREVGRLFEQGTVFRELVAHGYEVIATEDQFRELTVRPAHQLVAKGHLTQFEAGLVRDSAAKLYSQAVPQWLPSAHRAAVRAQLRAAVEVAHTSSSGPRFFWAHVVSPHPPLVFGVDGTFCFPTCAFFTPFASNLGMTKASFESAFVTQVEHVNTLVLETIDGILAGGVDPVIVIMSDHGVRHVSGNGEEHFRNFFAARTPGHGALFPDDVGAVTTMAVLLNAYLGTNHPIPDGNALFRGPDDSLLPLEPVRRPGAATSPPEA